MSRKKRQPRKLKIQWTLIVLLIGVATYYSIQNFTNPVIESEVLGKLPDGFQSHGIDISHYQNKIDWGILAESLDSVVSFVYYKSTEGLTYIDPLAKNHRKNLERLNIKNGAYHFFAPRLDAFSQAEHFVSCYSKSSISLPPVLDVETEGSSDKQLIKGMKIWLKKVEVMTGEKPIIYTSYHFYKTKFHGEFDGHQFWIASYSKKESRLKDDCIIHWQYSDRGKIPGIDGFVDLNFSKNKY